MKVIVAIFLLVAVIAASADVAFQKALEAGLSEATKHMELVGKHPVKRDVGENEQVMDPPAEAEDQEVEEVEERKKREAGIQQINAYGDTEEDAMQNTYKLIHDKFGPGMKITFK